MTEDEAKDELENKGIIVSVSYEEDSSAGAGTVIFQSIEEGTEVEYGTEVEIVVATELETAEPASNDNYTEPYYEETPAPISDPHIDSIDDVAIYQEDGETEYYLEVYIAIPSGGYYVSWTSSDPYVAYAYQSGYSVTNGEGYAYAVISGKNIGVTKFTAVIQSYDDESSYDVSEFYVAVYGHPYVDGELSDEVTCEPQPGCNSSSWDYWEIWEATH